MEDRKALNVRSSFVVVESVQFRNKEKNKIEATKNRCGTVYCDLFTSIVGILCRARGEIEPEGEMDLEFG